MALTYPLVHVDDVQPDAPQLEQMRHLVATAMREGAVRCWGAGTTGRLGYASTASVGDDDEPRTHPALGTSQVSDRRDQLPQRVVRLAQGRSPSPGHDRHARPAPGEGARLLLEADLAVDHVVLGHCDLVDAGGVAGRGGVAAARCSAV